MPRGGRGSSFACDSVRSGRNTCASSASVGWHSSSTRPVTVAVTSSSVTSARLNVQQPLVRIQRAGEGQLPQHQLAAALAQAHHAAPRAHLELRHAPALHPAHVELRHLHAPALGQHQPHLRAGDLQPSHAPCSSGVSGHVPSRRRFGVRAGQIQHHARVRTRTWPSMKRAGQGRPRSPSATSASSAANSGVSEPGANSETPCSTTRRAQRIQLAPADAARPSPAAGRQVLRASVQAASQVNG